MSDPFLSFRDLYHSLDEKEALDSIEDLLGGLPLIGFQSLGSTLFAEDKGLPGYFHTAPEFILRAGRRGPSCVEREGIRNRARIPAHIDDHLVARMKAPIELPSSGAEASTRALNDPPSHEYSYTPRHPIHPQRSTGHRRQTSRTVGRSSTIHGHGYDTPAHATYLLESSIRHREEEPSSRRASGHILTRQPSEHHRPHPSIPHLNRSYD